MATREHDARSATPESFAPSLPPAPPPIEQDYISRPAAMLAEKEARPEVPKDLLDDGWVRSYPTEPFRSIAVRGWLTFGLFALALVPSIFTAVTQMRWSYAAHHGDDPWTAETARLADQARTAMAFTVGVLAVAFVALAAWSRGAVQNIRRVGFTYAKVGWATWGWFLPFANLQLPFLQLRWIPRQHDLVARWKNVMVLGNALLPAVTLLASQVAMSHLFQKDARNMKTALLIARFSGAFSIIWIGASVVALVLSYYLVRRTNAVFAYITQRLD